MKLYLILAMALALTACAPVHQLNTPFQLHLNEEAKVEDLHITLISVLEDSRCPEGVFCIWEGTVKAIVNVQQGKENLGDITLVSSRTLQYQEETSIAGYKIKLVDALPAKHEGITIKPEEYVLTFMVTKE